MAHTHFMLMGITCDGVYETLANILIAINAVNKDRDLIAYFNKKLNFFNEMTRKCVLLGVIHRQRK